MVAVSILAVLVLLFSGVFSQVNSAWTTGEGNAERRRSVRALADFIGTELQSALLPVETIVTNGRGNLQFVINPPTSQVPDDYRNADAIFWQAPLATETSQGEIAEIGYFVKWEAAAGQGERPMLCRFFVNPSVGSGASTVPNPDFLIYDADPKRWLSKVTIDKAAPARKLDGYKGMFAENVLGLWVQCYRLKPALNDTATPPALELPRAFDSRIGYDLNSKLTTGTGTKDMRYLPGSVRLSLAQLDSRSAARLDPAAGAIKALAKKATDASDFLTQFGDQAKSSAPLRALLPGVRIYSTEIQILNAR